MVSPITDIPTITETNRLYLRPYQPGDGAMYFAVSKKNREHLREFEAGNALFSLESVEQAENVVQDLAAGWEKRKYFFFGAFLQETGEFAAQIYVGPLNWDTPEFEIGYIADVDHQGQGFVREAVLAVLQVLFEKLGAHRVRLECSSANIRSIRLAERCGFTLEGRLRETKRLPGGGYTDDLIYGLLKNEFIE